ncbi:uncharacterized protein SPSK_10830 [Sporothrix schenckii 1099-18]|uniref:Uncharacterized protein n=1 Tax=Sporothrix schenckii 1099-18 TaxID=1397361 RepID=A0A0F2MI72_SPOSC|nr:uncharacterized protein SPSK_10830 [Sporothrix schenckii 1099-18]KJR88530.1 hypothetical protein SPSK_10830 [Sporothrix schenckii 1099-18]
MSVVEMNGEFVIKGKGREEYLVVKCEREGEMKKKDDVAKKEVGSGGEIKRAMRATTKEGMGERGGGAALKHGPLDMS